MKSTVLCYKNNGIYTLPFFKNAESVRLSVIKFTLSEFVILVFANKGIKYANFLFENQGK
ncbi:hypothetical protein C4F49_03010 [Sphingobacterium sp. KB22]|uniref:Uncharacterized protein n=1 Tax=Sphingobacterium hungaricum TaxID=2082723 RepID=A0A928UXL9_9SPHI|nr:hypothetical protein [Sphingobacterium hungaricum]